MFDQFKQLGDLKKMRDQAMQIQRELEAEIIVLEEGDIKVTMTGNQKVKEVIIDGQKNDKLARVFNNALEKSQRVAASKLQGMPGGLGKLLGQ